MHILRNKKELLFFLVALLLLIGVITYGFYAVGFLTRQISTLLNPSKPRLQDMTQYNLKLLEDAGISTSTITPTTIPTTTPMTTPTMTPTTTSTTTP